jgi:excisionase family DNA binding protein
MSSADGQQPLFYSTTEAGKLFRPPIGRSRVQQLVASGQLPSFRLGRKILIPRRALLEMAGGAAERSRE